MGGYFHVDALQIYGSYDAALADCLSGQPQVGLARAIGRAKEILISDMDDAALNRGMRALGAGLVPPGGTTHRQWLAAIGAAMRGALG